MPKTFKVSRRMRYSDSELSLIKNTFAEQEETLILIRKFIFQGKMSESEIGYVRTHGNSPEIMAVLRKALCPMIEKQAPPFQTVDLLSSIDFQTIPHEHAELIIKGRQKAIKFLQQRLDQMTSDGDASGSDDIMFDSLVAPNNDPKEAHVNILARNFLLSHVDTQLFNSLLVIAGTKDEDPAEQKRRLQQDSSQ
jgi:hypothetical protein